MSERLTSSTITEDKLTQLYDLLDAYQNAPVLHTCLVPGCLHQYDALAWMRGVPSVRDSWSGAGWHQVRFSLTHPGGGHICPDHVELLAAHTPRRVTDTPEGWWQITCSCETWRTPAVRWHGVLRALWEEHILTASGKLPKEV